MRVTKAELEWRLAALEAFDKRPIRLVRASAAEFDLRHLAGFVPPEQYAVGTPRAGELGMVRGHRYVRLKRGQTEI